ncbi:MAG TPA: phosphonate ABC transporter, permease protein PhnE [Paracoccaceae bacterium]|nr:phosphonate ABC transporter, permease protein PhnE [Paracoccaceae bacterium]
MATRQDTARSRRTGEWAGFALTLGLGALVVWGMVDTGIDPARIVASGPRVLAFLDRMFPPDWSVLPTVVEASLETFHIALLGTVTSAVFSILLGALAAQSVTPRVIHLPVKWLLAAIRAIPLILVAMLMVGAVGLGPLPGILAIAFHSTGMLAKFYAEAIEAVPARSLEALDSAGASWLQKMRFGAWPQMAPDLVRDTLFRLELNIRESLVLGLVGAGGIGFYIQTYVRAFQYDKAATLTIVVILFVALIEALNHATRSLLK